MSDLEIIVLHSPKAGRGQGSDQLQRLSRSLQQSPGRAIVTSDLQMVRQRLQRSDHAVVVAAGGDGTLSLAAKYVMRWGGSVMPMPMGTENLLARRMGYRADADFVLASLRQSRVHQMDAMRVQIGRREHLSLVMATAGFDAAVVRRVHLRRRGHIRRWTYAGPIIQSMTDYPFAELTVRADGHPPVRCRWAMVFNVAAYAGNLSIAPGAVSDDGLLDVVCFAGGRVIDAARYLAGVVTGRHEQFSDVTNLATASVSVESPHRVPIQCDGDYAGRLPTTIECLPGAVSMIRPRV